MYNFVKKSIIQIRFINYKYNNTHIYVPNQGKNKITFLIYFFCSILNVCIKTTKHQVHYLKASSDWLTVPTCSLNSTDVLEYSLLFVFPEVVNFQGSQATAHALCWLTEVGAWQDVSGSILFVHKSLLLHPEKLSFPKCADCLVCQESQSRDLLSSKENTNHNREKKTGNILMKWEKAEPSSRGVGQKFNVLGLLDSFCRSQLEWQCLSLHILLTRLNSSHS